MGGAEKLRVAAKFFGLLQTIAALAVFALTLSGGSASAVLLSQGNSVTLSDGTEFYLTTCGNTNISTCGVDTFTASPDGKGIVITGPGGVLESTTSKGTVDTFLQFTVTAPIQNSISSFGIAVTGCAGNQSIPACSASTGSGSAGTTIYANTAADLSGTVLAANPVQFSGSANTTVAQVAATNDFATNQTTFYVQMDLSVSGPAFNGGGYASFDAITLEVPEPASWAVLVFGLAGLGMLRRRQRIV
jgi:hypothetical protein